MISLCIATRIVKNEFNFKQIIQKLQPIAIDYFSTHSYYIVNSLFVLYVLHLKHRNIWPPDALALDALNDYTWQKKF